MPKRRARTPQRDAALYKAARQRSQSQPCSSPRGHPCMCTIASAEACKKASTCTSGEPYRVLSAFDPRSAAILLLGSNKVGDECWSAPFLLAFVGEARHLLNMLDFRITLEREIPPAAVCGITAWRPAPISSASGWCRSATGASAPRAARGATSSRRSAGPPPDPEYPQSPGYGTTPHRGRLPHP